MPAVLRCGVLLGQFPVFLLVGGDGDGQAGSHTRLRLYIQLAVRSLFFGFMVLLAVFLSVITINRYYNL